MAYQITRPEQKRPSNWLQALRGDQFKEALVTFLVDYLENNNSARILGSKKLIVNNGDTCYSFISQEDRMVKSEEVAYYLKHEEADTRMIYHVGQLPSGTNVVVRTVDTDVVVIALGCFHQLQDKKIWVESGVQSKNNLTYISINQLFDQLGEPLCKALPFYHAFTGCDYTSLFNRKRKITLFKFLKKYPELQETFLNLSNSEGISDDIKSIIESFVCQMYGRKKKQLSRSSMCRDLCYQEQTEKRICFSQPNSSKEVAFKHNPTVLQSLTSKDQAIYLCCKYLDELT